MKITPSTRISMKGVTSMAKAKKIPANARQFPLVDQAEQAEKDMFSQHLGYIMPEQPGKVCTLVDRITLGAPFRQ